MGGTVHNQLIQLMQKMGYQADVNGVCYGFAGMAIQANLTDNKEKGIKPFDAKVKLLINTDTDTLIRNIQQAHDKVKRKEALSTQDEMYLDLHALLENIEINFQGHRYKELFPELNRQNFSVTSKIAQSAEIEQQGGIERVTADVRNFNKAKLTKYFQNISASRKKGSTTPLSFMVLSKGHAISIGFDGNTWTLSDPNYMPKKTFADPDLLAGFVMSYLTGRHDINEHEPLQSLQDRTLNLTIEMFSAGNHLKENKKVGVKQKQKNKKLLRVNENIVSSVDTLGSNWLTTAYLNGDKKMVLNILDKVKDKNIVNIIDAEKGVSLITTATYLGDLAFVQELMSRNAVPFHEDFPNVNAIHAAVGQGHGELVKYLIECIYPEHRAKVINAPDTNEWSAMHSAAEFAKTDILNYLMTQEGVDVNQPHPPSGITPLFAACRAGKLDNVRALLDHGANLNAATLSQESPLLAAIENGHFKIAELLIERGADCSITSQNNKNPLSESIAKKNIDLVDKILSNMSAQDLQNKNLEQYLCDAIKENNLQLIALLLDKGCNVNDSYPDGFTPLHLAVAFGSLEVAQMLLDAGADINAMDFKGDTPVVMAKRSFDKEMESVLISKAAVDLIPSATQSHANGSVSAKHSQERGTLTFSFAGEKTKATASKSTGPELESNKSARKNKI